METREIEYNGTSHVIAHGEYVEGVTPTRFDDTITYYADDAEFALPDDELIAELLRQGAII